MGNINDVVGIQQSNAKATELTREAIELLEEGEREGFENATLVLVSVGIEDSMIPALCEWLLKFEGKITGLVVGKNNITSRGATELFDFLRAHNSSIEDINLNSNQLDDECMKSLGEYIKNNEKLEGASVGNNKITDKGIENIAEYIIGSAHFTHLRLYGNVGISDASVPFLREIGTKSAVSGVNLFSTSISFDNLTELTNLFKIPVDHRQIPVFSSTKSAAKASWKS